MKQVQIKGDYFNIADKLKEINPQYTLYLNITTGRYEVHVGEQLAFVLPYDELDDRTIGFAKWQQLLGGAQ